MCTGPSAATHCERSGKCVPGASACWVGSGLQTPRVPLPRACSVLEKRMCTAAHVCVCYGHWCVCTIRRGLPFCSHALLALWQMCARRICVFGRLGPADSTIALAPGMHFAQQAHVYCSALTLTALSVLTSSFPAPGRPAGLGQQRSVGCAAGARMCWRAVNSHRHTALSGVCVACTHV